jgi:hypothetical protein
MEGSYGTTEVVPLTKAEGFGIEESIPQGLKPARMEGSYGTTEVVPLTKAEGFGIEESIPQGLKPARMEALTARLKSCP